MSFLQTGIYTEGCIVPVTTEDPSLTVLQTNPGSKKWGILFFIGKPIAENCIAIINDETNMSSLDRSILTCPIVTREGTFVSSVAIAIDKHMQRNVI